MTMTLEEVEIRMLEDRQRVKDLQKEVATLTVRHDAMEAFIKDQYPMHFAGETGTVADPDLAPVNLTIPNGAGRADPATCSHPSFNQVFPAWAPEGIEICNDCGANKANLKKDTRNAPR